MSGPNAFLDHVFWDQIKNFCFGWFSLYEILSFAYTKLYQAQKKKQVEYAIYTLRIFF